jgi:hypothetical protein
VTNTNVDTRADFLQLTSLTLLAATAGMPLALYSMLLDLENISLSLHFAHVPTYPQA